MGSVDMKTERSGSSPSHEARWRRIRLSLILVAVAGGVLTPFGWSCMRRDYCPGAGELIGLTTFAVVVLFWTFLPRSRDVLVDDRGMVIHRHRVPWNAIRSIAWVHEPNARGSTPVIEIGVQRTPGYRAPRAGRLTVDPRDLPMTPADLWKTVVEQAQPHHVLVLSTPPDTTETGSSS
jgi:hypothetical protein